MTVLLNSAVSSIERGYLPDWAVRMGIRHLIRERLAEIHTIQQDLHAYTVGFIQSLAVDHVAPYPEKANSQHYEIPAAFFQGVLGPHLKYSSAFWPKGVECLAEAEEVSIKITAAHADLHDDQHILELGCGWGSLTLWMAAQYPHSHITAVSNSHSQKAYIDSQAQARRLWNITVLTKDMNKFDIQTGQFDRVVSVEMFEHMRNWPQVFNSVHRWLKPDGLFFLHIFVHRNVPYVFEVRNTTDWMSEHFFSGGMMPSDDLPLKIASPLRLLQHWQWEGTHYQKTADAWLARMDEQRESLWPLFVHTYGKEDAYKWWMRWRVFFMACAELFGYRNGREWWVSHYLFQNTATPS